jgi:hypothetical protein
VIVRINGSKLEEVRRLEVVTKETPNIVAIGVILIGTLAGMGWWVLWQ